MTKLAKEIPVHLACPACGKTQRVKLKWARNHKSLKCKDCRKAIDLRAPQAKSLIARTAQAVATFERPGGAAGRGQAGRQGQEGGQESQEAGQEEGR